LAQRTEDGNKWRKVACQKWPTSQDTTKLKAREENAISATT